ncbi:hypothetical protein [Thioflexithrix psekupsensis]|uniref:Uncharacterized protein n=1 Tax=Thioflexithrix psekupsensis TaxID=1570016 RepID=A0A251XAE0_9GAMM|nr:hypothetical protein [Thioflexithrix psekupsensis]OUD15339.1 hypothetical protein TPSD3_02075 [Thioflexithrix psekupsensis]
MKSLSSFFWLVFILLGLIVLLFLLTTKKMPDKPLKTDNPITSSENNTIITPPISSKPILDSFATPDTHDLSTFNQIDLASSLPNLSQLENRQHYYENLLTQSPAVLWQQWQTLQHTQNPNAIRARQLIAIALPLRLRDEFDAAVYHALAAHLTLPETTPYGYVSQIAQLLGQTATEPALIALVQQALILLPNSEPRIPILQAISYSTRLRWNNQFHTELSPPLEQAWQQLQTSQDIALVNTISEGLVSIGAENGLKQLFNSLEPVNFSSLETLQKNNQIVPLSAFQAFKNLNNPDAITLLTETLYHAPPNSLTQQATVHGLMALAINDNDHAVQQLRKWEQYAPESMREQLIHWLNEINP